MNKFLNRINKKDKQVNRFLYNGLEKNNSKRIVAIFMAGVYLLLGMKVYSLVKDNKQHTDYVLSVKTIECLNDNKNKVEIITNNNNIVFKEGLIRCIRTIDECLPDVSMPYFVSGLNELKVIYSSEIKALEYYSPRDSTIIIKDNRALLHGLFHYISSAPYDEVNNLANVGYAQKCDTNDDWSQIGEGLNEGMTELLVDEVTNFKDNVDGYPYEINTVRMLCDILGADTMLENYFKADLYTLTEKLTAITGDDEITFSIIKNLDELNQRFDNRDLEGYKDWELRKKIEKTLVDVFVKKINMNVSSEPPLKDILINISNFKVNLMYQSGGKFVLSTDSGENSFNYFLNKEEDIIELLSDNYNVSTDKINDALNHIETIVTNSKHSLPLYFVKHGDVPQNVDDAIESIGVSAPESLYGVSLEKQLSSQDNAVLESFLDLGSKSK